MRAPAPQPIDDLAMLPDEKRAASLMAALYASRMLGMFMILPTFALFAQGEFTNATALMIGLTIGIYGLTQAMLQLPFGMWSDKIGRKPVIALGLVLFAIGSVVCALAPSLEWMLVGRALQGAGAISAVLMALLADLTRETVRLRAMSLVGMTIGLSFTVSLVAGPALDSVIGVRGIFWLTALMAIVGLIVLYTLVPNPPPKYFSRDVQADTSSLGIVLRDKALLRLNFGIFSLHLLLTALFIAVPLALVQSAGLDKLDHWMVYLPVMLVSFALMVPFIVIGEKRAKLRPVFLIAIALIGLSEAILWDGHDTLWLVTLGLLVFFTGFNVMEASLPSLIAKFAPAHLKGTASGVYATSQFLGSFVGGVLGGALLGWGGFDAIFAAAVLLTLVWFAVAWGMGNPDRLSSFVLPLMPAHAQDAAATTQVLMEIEGVREAWVDEIGLRAYMKIDRSLVDEAALIHWAASKND
jgi:MFS family permease